MDIEKIEGGFVPTSDKKSSVGKKGIVSTAHPRATKAGLKMLRKGGNAVDAACAAALALGVCEPQASGLGGQSMAIIYLKNRKLGIDGSSRAPLKIGEKKLKRTERFTGYKAATVPSTPAVIGYLSNKYGELRWHEILKPSIRIAKRGYKITKLQRSLQIQSLMQFESIPSRSGARFFLKDGAVPYDVGDRFVQPELGEFLEFLAENGPESFYSDYVASKVDVDMRKNGGLIRKKDFHPVPWPSVDRLIHKKYRSVDVYTLPPPSAGRTLLLVLMMLENIDSNFLRGGTPKSYHYVAETFRKAFLERTLSPMDPKVHYMPKNDKMLSRKFAGLLSASIRDMIDPSLPLRKVEFDEYDTTHLSVMDGEGNGVGITQSIEQVYGSKTASEDFGFLYNNYVSAFEPRRSGHPHFLKASAVPYTLVAPCLVFHGGKLWMVVGSPGSQRIFSSVSHFISRVVDGNMPISTAMQGPRMHCSVDGTISMEAKRFDPDIIDHLKSMGYTIDRKEPFSFYHGAVHAVLKRQSGDGFQGVAEVRRDGSSEGML